MKWSDGCTRRAKAGPLVALVLGTALAAVVSTLPGTAAPTTSVAAAAPAPRGAPVQSAPGQEATSEPTPDDGRDLPHPVLDEVEVGDTPDTRRTEANLESAMLTQAEAAHELIVAEGARTEAALDVMSAVDRVTEAEGALASAEEALAVEERVLARRAEVEANRLDDLEEARDDLRSMAVAAYTSHSLEDVAVVGTFDEMSAGPRRESLRRKVTDDRMRVVEVRKAGWEEAVVAREAQDEVVDAAAAARDDRRIDLQTANAVRDGATEVLDAATQVVRDRRDVHDRLALRTVEARYRHREAKLTAPVIGTDFTLVGLHAYWSASAGAACPTPWWLLAGIGRVESHHGTAQGSRVEADGLTSTPIRGIPLDGGPGIAAIRDTDGGLLDGDTTWDRAVGPMQFIPSTWARWGTDGNGDDVADPHNLYDAAASAALYLCVTARGSLLDEAAQRTGLLAYNRSVPYGNLVLATGGSYRDTLDLPDLGTPDPDPAPR